MSPRRAQRYVLGLGSSLGERWGALEGAIRALDALAGCEVLRVSRVYQSPPMDERAHNPFFNAAVLVRWRGEARELLAAAKELERRFGRRASTRWADRALDVDILWAERRLRERGLRVPHPGLRHRDFALLPLLDVLPGRLPGRLRGGLARGSAHSVGGLGIATLGGRPIGEAMKFFIDTANLDHIRQANAWGIVDGVTTNPSLIAAEGGDFVETVAEICSIVDGPVSAEVVAHSTDDMLRQARLLARIHDNVVVKVPLTPEGIAAVSHLTAEGIKTNVTLCFSPVQALLAAKVGATYISPFIGRVDDVGLDGMTLIQEIVDIYNNYPELDTQVLAASIRHPQHVLQAALSGSDVATIPFDVMKKLFHHPLTDIGNEKFERAWDSVPDRDIVTQVSRWLEQKGR